MPFEDDLRDEAGKLIARFERYARELRDEDARRTRRTGLPNRGRVRRPAYWSVDRGLWPH